MSIFHADAAITMAGARARNVVLLSEPQERKIALTYSNLAPPVRTPPPTRGGQHRRIIDLVSRMHGTTAREVMSRVRFGSPLLARHAAVCAVKEWEEWHGRELTLTQLGRIFNLDNTSVIYLLRRRGYWDLVRKS